MDSMADGLIIKPMDKRSAWAWGIHQPTKLSKNRPETIPGIRLSHFRDFFTQQTTWTHTFQFLVWSKTNWGGKKRDKLGSSIWYTQDMDMRPTISAAHE